MAETASVVVTGGAGFIGCAISAGLAERFGRVIVLDNLHPQIHAVPVRPVALHSSVDFRRTDITQSSAWVELLAEARPDVIVHLAAETGTGQSLTESSRHAHVNVVGTTTMLDALSRHEHTPNTKMSWHRAARSTAKARGGARMTPLSIRVNAIANDSRDAPGISRRPNRCLRRRRRQCRVPQAFMAPPSWRRSIS